jgi:outer membrane biosynthesis protein TonB
MRKNTFFFLVVLLLTAAGVTRAQQTDKDTVLMPYPVGGWEKFDSLIVYPEIARRAGIDGYYEVQIRVDTLGNATVTYDEKRIALAIARAIEDAAKKVKWVPVVRNGNPFSYEFTLPVLFYTKKERHAPLIIKRTVAPVVDKRRIISN